MFGKKKIKELENKVSQMELATAELMEYVQSLELELARKDKKIAMMEKMMKLDQVRRGAR
jgi:hypothetical protein